MIVFPSNVKVGTWMKFENITRDQLDSFVKEQALNALMGGTPFAEVAGMCVQYALWWQDKQQKRSDK